MQNFLNGFQQAYDRGSAILDEYSKQYNPVRQFVDKVNANVQNIAPQNKAQSLGKGVAQTGVDTLQFISNPFKPIADIAVHPKQAAQGFAQYAGDLKDKYINAQGLEYIKNHPDEAYRDLYNTLWLAEGVKTLAGVKSPKSIPSAEAPSPKIPSIQKKPNIPSIKKSPSETLNENIYKYEVEPMTHYSPQKIVGEYDLNRVGENMGQTTGKGLFLTNDSEYGIKSYALTNGDTGYANIYEIPKAKYGIQGDLPLGQQPQHVKEFFRNLYKDLGYPEQVIESNMVFKDGYQALRQLVDEYGSDVTTVLPDYNIPLIDNPSQLERQIFDKTYMRSPISQFEVSEKDINKIRRN